MLTERSGADCAASLSSCALHPPSIAAQTAPDLSVNISVPYATTTPTAVPEDPDQPFSLDANGNVTVLNDRWIDEGFVSATSNDEEESTDGYTQLRLGDQSFFIKPDFDFYRGVMPTGDIEILH